MPKKPIEGGVDPSWHDQMADQLLIGRENPREDPPGKRHQERPTRWSEIGTKLTAMRR
jgi:hypothetical protein